MKDQVFKVPDLMKTHIPQITVATSPPFLNEHIEEKCSGKKSKMRYLIF